MKAVERKNDIKAAVSIGESAYVALFKSDVFQPQPFRFFPRLRHHIRGIVETGDLGPRQRLINRHGEDPRSHRNFQQLPREIFRNAGQCTGQIIVAFGLVHSPYQAADGLSRQRGAGDHSVVKIIAARQTIGIANGFLSFHAFHLFIFLESP